MAKALSYRDLRELVLRGPSSGRFTQDSPILADVWIQFARDLHTGQSNLLKAIDLLLTPLRDAPPAYLLTTIGERLQDYRDAAAKDKADLSLNRTYVVGKFYFDEMICVLLPLTKWWNEYVWRADKPPRKAPKGKKAKSDQPHAGLTPTELRKPAGRKRIIEELSKGDREFIDNRVDDLVWLVRVVGTLELERRREAQAKVPPAGEKNPPDEKSEPEQQLEAFLELIDKVPPKSRQTEAILAESPQVRKDFDNPLWLVSLNRDINPTVWKSVESTKADAARRLFNIHCDKIRWAVVDSGVDATHPAFRNRKLLLKGPAAQRSRILETYDFTRLRKLVPPSGQFAWDELRPQLSVPHDGKYEPPTDRHGTHVAGIIGMDWRQEDDPEPPDEYDLVGLCPDIELFDLRVLTPKGGTEFDILGALQFIRWLNANKDEPVIHGVNISISLLHDKANYACGRTPICDECERLMASGTVVVAAAGNEGWAHYETEMGRRDGFRTVCITDPGNAETVITVGATHRFKPHTYGVSYFSSRGPTGDGRIKPDLVAPGEKIKSAAPGGEVNTLDGTSMAAPHVSGAAAMLMARHHELIGQSQRIKEILCRTATDLGRERYFQGAGMLDVLRALQSV